MAVTGCASFFNRNKWLAMLTRLVAGVAVAYLALLLSGCGKRPRTEEDVASGKDASATPANLRAVTLHVTGMKQRLNLF